MKIQQLQCFLAVERYKSFSRAADSMFMTQSALSKQILALENELGVILFDRRIHKLKLTQAGEKIYAHAIWIVGEHEKLLESLRFLEDISAKKLALSVPYDMSHYGIADMVIDFEREHPTTVAESHECSHEVMVYNLENRLTDVAIGFQEFWPQSERFVVFPLCRDPLMLVMHKTHPLAQRAEILLSQAERELFCLPREDTDFFRLFQKLCTAAGFSPNLTLSDVRISTIKRYIQHGMRLTMTSKLRAEHVFPETDFRAVPMAGAAPLTLALLLRREQTGETCRAFAAHAESYYTCRRGEQGYASAGCVQKCW